MAELREALEAAFKEQEEKVEAPAEESTKDESPKEVDKEPLDQSVSKDKEEPTSEVTEPELEYKPIRKAPSSWKPDAQAAWVKADNGEELTKEEIKSLALESERRESDFHKGVSEFKEHAQKARAYEAAINPYKQHLQSLGIDAPTAISGLLKAEQMLRTGDPATKAQYLLKLAKDYRIDIGVLGNQEPQQQYQTDPQSVYMMQQLHALQQEQKQLREQREYQENQNALASLDEFSKSGNIHLDEVRNDMADLLESGKATSLQDAYEKAIWLNANVRTTLIEQQRQDAHKKAIEQAKNARAKSASVSIKGSSPASGGASSQSNSLRAILEAQFANQN
tara:strand:+ start:3522 stop:4532 length:1011 start_codon:yes stop_codon:yes gene_type:complete